VDRAEHAVAMGVELALVRLEEAAEGVLVAVASRLEELALAY
jgi:hypothetical protein